MEQTNSDNNFQDTETTTELGSIETTEDMCLVFSNFIQHRASKFELINKTKPGARQIVVFFLVD